MLSAICSLLSVEKMAVILLNFIYALGGGLMCIPLCMFAYYIFNKVTPTIKFAEELNNENCAVGLVIAMLLLGVCICTGLVIGLGLN